jgi:hypothetical protein
VERISKASGGKGGMSSTRAVRGTGFNVFACVRGGTTGSSRAGFACAPFEDLGSGATGLTGAVFDIADSDGAGFEAAGFGAVGLDATGAGVGIGWAASFFVSLAFAAGFFARTGSGALGCTGDRSAALGWPSTTFGALVDFELVAGSVDFPTCAPLLAPGSSSAEESADAFVADVLVEA